MAPNTSIAKDTVFHERRPPASSKTFSCTGELATVNIPGVLFNNFTVQGHKVTSQTDSDGDWDINQYVSNITFQ